VSLLRLSGVTAFYGASQALFGVDLDLREGEAAALLGRNGMGKTTTIHTIFGAPRARSGEIEFDGRDITSTPTHLIARLGIGLTPEGRRCFPNLTVEENLRAAARPGPWTMASVCDLFPRLAERAGQAAATLSGGEQQMLAIARALTTNPKLLVLDEATEGLAPLMRKEIWASVRRLKAEAGLSMLIVDKSLRELAEIADRAFILQRGQTVWTGDIAAIDDDLKASLLGV
jgi:branched-chain amino acid transport system ATP-binding protein